MRHFLLRLCLMFFSVCAVFGLIDYLGRDVLAKETVYADDWMLSRFSKDIEEVVIANVGNSHGFYGFNYENAVQRLDGIWMNYALPSQTLQYDYLILDCFKESMKEGAVILIPVSYFSLYTEEYDDTFEVRNNRYYDLLDYSHIERPRLIRYIEVKYLKYGFIAENSTAGMFKPNVPMALNNSSNFEPPTEGSKYSIREMAQMTAQSHYDTVIKRENGAAVLQQRCMKSIENMVELCRERNWVPVLVSMPYTKEYTESFPPSFIEQYYRDMSEIAEDSGVLWLDYSQNEQYCMNSQLFSDADHLGTGAVMFTDDIIQELVDRNLLQIKEEDG